MKNSKETLAVAVLLFLCFCLPGCGSDDDVEGVCGLIPCSNIACTGCGWPAGHCTVQNATLFSTSLPLGAVQPFYLLMNIVTISDVSPQHEVVCQDGRVRVLVEGVEVFTRDLEVDVPQSGICEPFNGAGSVSVELVCPGGYPTQALYGITIADAEGNRVGP